MAQFGYTSTPTFGFIDSGAHNQAAYHAGAFPSPGGFVNQIHVYCRTHTGSTTSLNWCIWDSAGNLLFSTNGGSCSTTASLKNSSSSLSYYIPAGTDIYIGVEVPSANGLYIDYAANSGHVWLFGSNATNPGNLAGTTSEAGESMEAYVDYTPLAAPTISNVTPSPVAPTQDITITGTDFTYATGVTIGGVAASSFTIDSDTQITATLAATTPAGTQAVVVTNPAGSSAGYNITVGGIAWVNTNTQASPVWTMGIVYTNTGSEASPTWTVASEVDANTGTLGSPVWTHGS